MQLSFAKWLKIFDTFPEGLALVKEGNIEFSNRSMYSLLGGDPNEMDAQYDILTNQLQTTEVTRLGTQEYITTAWDFITKQEDKGGPFKVKSTKKDTNYKEKFLSLNKVPVPMIDNDLKLFVTRDLGTMVSLQNQSYIKQLLNCLTERMMRQV